jgi:ABC-type transport system involved in cytochrome bd biosynthesis fused ATPase/permease subunit
VIVMQGGRVAASGKKPQLQGNGLYTELMASA